MVSLSTRFSDLSPPVKIAAWLILIAVLASIVQAVAWALGLPFNILASSNGGRGVLLALALASLLTVIAVDRRPVSDFGLFVGPRWKKLWFGGIAIGAVTYAAYVLVALGVGAYDLSFDKITPSRSGKALLAGMTAMPLAIVQQILFSGYLLSMLRDRYQRLTAVIISAFMFAVLGRLHDPLSLLQPSAQPLIIGLFLVAALLGVLRLQSGSILLPAGLLAGWMLVRRVLGKTYLTVPAADSSWVPWMVPRGDARQAPMMWLFLAVAFAGCWWMLRRRGEGKVSTLTPALDTDFKRVFPLSHGSALAPLDVWLGRLAAARFRVGLAYLPRLIAVLVFSAVNTIVSLPERLLLPLLLRHRQVRDPVFIVGVHRSGTTHLHNLLALDPQFCTPRAYHILNPIGFLFSGWLVAPVAGAFMPWKRPMDAVRFHLFAPQEDEFVMTGVSRLSPYWGMTFPTQWPQYDRYIFPDKMTDGEQAAWRRHYTTFVKKLTLFSGKQPLLKNPYNTARVGLLRRMYPRARFVHIYRDPETVYRSNMHLAREGHVLNQLQDPVEQLSYSARFLGNYQAMEAAFYRDISNAGDGTVVEVRFEDLERSPMTQLKEIYDDLGLRWTEAYEQRLRQYLGGLAGYKKNRHEPLPEFERRLIRGVMQDFLYQWGYERETQPERRAA
jgi:hypothetical protein